MADDGGLRTIAGKEFGAEVVPADGIEFLRCHFAGTTLAFSGQGHFALPECSGTYSIQFTGSARVVMDQLALLHGCGMADFVEGLFAKVRQPFAGDSIN